jgi:hypothetical protein
VTPIAAHHRRGGITAAEHACRLRADHRDIELRLERLAELASADQPSLVDIRTELDALWESILVLSRRKAETK